MKQLLLGWFLFKYGRNLFVQAIKLTLLLLLVSMYGLYKLAIFLALAIKDSPIESVIGITTILGLYLLFRKVRYKVLRNRYAISASDRSNVNRTLKMIRFN